MSALAVVICTHNPCADYLGREIESLRQQTLSRSQRQLLVVDNASRLPVSALCDFSWHPQGKHIQENDLGLAAARMRGMNEGGCERSIGICR